ncbi:MAG: alpha/beta hydrolase [Alphaproteobacteria bacterium]|nr:alpha/beta hydrolase [Alphaproteobacteria bacterium]
MLDQLPSKIETIEDVRAWDAAAERHETPCGTGSIVWRKWGSGPPVIMCHGGSGSWTHWCKSIPVHSRTHTLWLPDLPGLGDSASPSDLSHPAGSAEALNIGIRQLIPREHRPRIVAFSFGCHVSSLALGGLGDYIRDFLIIGTSALGRKDRPIMDFPKERADMTEEERREVHRGVLEMLMFHRPERIDELAITLQAENVAKARFRSRIHSHTDNVKRAVARTKVPIRCIWGEHDVVGHPDIPTVLGILGEHHPEMISTTIPDAGHWVMYEKADEFNDALAAMLAN